MVMNKELEDKYNQIVKLLEENPEETYSDDFIMDKYDLSYSEYEEIKLVLYVCNVI